MKKIIRLTESDLTKIVKRIIKENIEFNINDTIDPLSQFTSEELMKIKENVIRYSQPGFFEDYEARLYLYYNVAKEDKTIYDSLVEWLERNGVDTRFL